MTKTIEIKNCSECPFLRLERYHYCRKKFNNDADAYRAGEYAEYSNEIAWLFKNCPL